MEFLKIWIYTLQKNMSHIMKIRNIFQKCSQVCDFLHQTLGGNKLTNSIDKFFKSS